MLWVPQKGVLRVEHNLGTVGVGTLGTAVTTGATAATKGSAVQLIAATAFDAYLVKVIASAYGAAATASAGALDIQIGAATEEVLIPNLLMGYCGGDTGNFVGPGRREWLFPLYIPAGSRLTAKAAGERVLTAVQVGIFLYGGHGVPPFRVGSKVTTYGMGTVPNGTTIVPGQSGAEGAWTQIVATTTEDHFAFVPSFQSSADTTTQTRYYFVDMGIGAATEEQIGPDSIFESGINEMQGGPVNAFPVFHDVPSSTRLVMRASSNGGTLDVNYNGCIHAVS